MDEDAIRCREALEHLTWRLVHLARSGNTLIGLGEIINTLASFHEEPEGYEIDISVGVEVGFKRGDASSSEGLSYGFQVSPDGISFDKTMTVYDKQFGSDWNTEDMGLVGWGRGLVEGPQRWFDEIEQVLSQDDCRVTVSRDHV